MKIETNFNDGDTIYFLNDKKVCDTIVRGVKIEQLNGILSIIYLCNKEEGGNVHIKVYQDDAFKSKSALLKSL